MSSNRNTTCEIQRTTNGYSRDDVMRIASEYKNKRIKVISEAAKLGGKGVGEIGEVVLPKIKKNGSQPLLRANRFKRT
ncbi:hypothetical protein [Rahnella laticis]|uniref:hypothetical protein n=1 Tax=Rahnella laticis TaxID=2787622 RepID=UPI0018A2FA6F|nr:hypothetical protein [Rahnella laticis]MBF7997466.1 hypothetical protein [Rahnella laticis]